jgi:mannitol/fructose-specific phosphotransferase system IIA component (Ntr-type)
MSTSEFLSLGEVAASLGWSPRFVECLATGGQLPGIQTDGVWRFRRADLVEWLDPKIQTLDTQQVAELEHKLESELQSESRKIRIADRLRPEQVELVSPAPGRREVLKGLVDLAEKTGLVTDGLQLLASLVEREELCSTALPGGFALCHPRRPSPHLSRRTVFALLRTQQPVAFGAEDGSATRLFFLLAATDDRAHLYALARLTRILRGRALEELLAARSPEDVIEIIQRREAQIDDPSDGREPRPR